jgi:hypothetical protein
MGMDVYGRDPFSDKGEHFRNNIWWWRPLADYCNRIAPDICRACEHWYHNDADGLQEHDAVALADVLDEHIQSGQTLLYEKSFSEMQESAPDEPCDKCHGTGVDPWKSDAKCPLCQGTGSVEAFIRWYSFSVENVKEFVEFLRGCGGFRIC